MKKKILQRESWRMTFSCINRRETDLTTFHFKTQRKAKQKKKKKRERELALLSHTAPQRPLLQTSPVFPLSFASSISPFIPISSLPSAFVYSFGHGASYLKIVFSSLFLDFLAVDFIYWDTFFFVSLRVFVWPLNCHLAASIVDSQPCLMLSQWILHYCYVNYGKQFILTPNAKYYVKRMNEMHFGCAINWWQSSRKMLGLIINHPRPQCRSHGWLTVVDS